MVATDIAARGLDIDQLPHVVNFELPNVPEDYVHRIGRTGRAGKEGEAISLVCVDELKLLEDIEQVLKREIPKEIMPGYEVDPSIKAEPIQNGRGARRQQGGGAHSGHRDSEHKRPRRASNKKRGEFQAKDGEDSRGKARNSSAKGRPPRNEAKSGNRAKPANRPTSAGNRRSGKSRDVPALLGGG